MVRVRPVKFNEAFKVRGHLKAAIAMIETGDAPDNILYHLRRAVLLLEDSGVTDAAAERSP